MVFDKLNCKLYRESDFQIKREATATKKDGPYTLDTDSSPKAYNVANCQETQELWHKRLMHLNERVMSLIRKGLAIGIF